MRESNKMKLEMAAKPYIDQGYIITSESNHMMRLSLIKDNRLKNVFMAVLDPKTSHTLKRNEWIATVTIRINSAGAVEVMGQTPEKIRKEKQRAGRIFLICLGLFILFVWLCSPSSNGFR